MFALDTQVMSAAKDGSRPLHWAASKNQLAAATRLLHLGCPVDIQANDLSGPIHRAAYEGHVAMIQLLVQAGAQVNMRADCGCVSAQVPRVATCTPLPYLNLSIHAVERGRERSLAATDRSTPLHWATFLGHLGAVEALLAVRASPSQRTRLGLTPLHMAAMNGHAAVAGAILRTGEVDVDVQDVHDQSPLQWAARHGKVEVRAPSLIWFVGWEMSSRGRFTTPARSLWHGCSPCYAAKCVWGVVRRPARPNRTKTNRTNGASPRQVLTKLINHGADVNVKSKDGSTSLHHAAANCHTRACIRLVEMGADGDCSDAAGCTPVRQATVRECERPMAM